MPQTNVSRVDFTNKYNTVLSAEDESKFRKWLDVQSQKLKRPIWRDLYDYDLRGFFASGGDMDGGHLPDTFKKPNHPTFSSESKWNDDTHHGGEWIEQQDGSWIFRASPTNIAMHGMQGLAQYFMAREPGNRVIL